MDKSTRFEKRTTEEIDDISSQGKTELNENHILKKHKAEHTDHFNSEEFIKTFCCNERWNLVQECLKKILRCNKVKSITEIMSKLFHNAKIDDFSALEFFFAELQDETEVLETVQFLASVALDHKYVLPQCMERLVQSQPKTIKLSQRQCLCLLALAFFDMIPVLPFMEPLKPFSMRFWLRSEKEKLKCIFCYFHVMSKRAKADPENWGSRQIIFIRNVVQIDKETLKAQLNSCHLSLLDASINSSGKIEDCQGMIQADFANKWIGGGVLTWGSVQEEIRFLLSPECIVSRFLCDVMSDNEAILIVGSERFCNYTGYSKTFRFSGQFVNETTDFCSDGVLNTHLVAFDARPVPQNDPGLQFNEDWIFRDLIKLYAALSIDISSSENRLVDFATGNWGCGVFHGDPQLKFILQWMICSFVGRKLVYFPFGERKLYSCEQLIQRSISQKLTVGKLCDYLLTYQPDYSNPTDNRLFDFLFLSITKANL